MDTDQPGDAKKALEFARQYGVDCRMCGHPMQGEHMQCVNPKCMWRDTTLADQADIGSLPTKADAAQSDGTKQVVADGGSNG